MFWKFWQWVLSLLPDAWTEPIEPIPAAAGAGYTAAAEYTGDTSGGSDTTAGDADDPPEEPPTPPTDNGAAGQPEPPPDTMDTSRGTAGQDYNGSGKVKEPPPEVIIDLRPKDRGSSKGRYTGR